MEARAANVAVMLRTIFERAFSRELFWGDIIWGVRRCCYVAAKPGGGVIGWGVDCQQLLIADNEERLLIFGHKFEGLIVNESGRLSSVLMK